MHEFKLNRLETTKLIGPIVDRHWESLIRAPERGQKTAWVAGLFTMLTQVMDIPTHFMAGYASYAAGRRQIDPLFEAAEADGQLRDCCSYHRCHMGLLALARKKQPIPEMINIPVPDLLVCTRVCPEHSHYMDSLFRQYPGTPYIPIDIPRVYKEEDIPSAVAFVERQLKEEAIPTIEHILGRSFNYDRLIEVITILKRTAELRQECLELMAVKPAPWTLFDVGVSLAPVTFTMGQPDSIEYYEKLKEELEQRVSQKVGAIEPEERYRLYFDGFIPWRWLGSLSRSLASHGATLICGRYPFEPYPRPDLLEPENPLHTLSEQLIRWWLPEVTVEGGLQFITHAIPKYSIDGLVMLHSPTCRFWNMGQLDYVDEAERHFGTPGVVIEADMVDSEFWSDAQINNRLQSLLEMIDARRQHKY